MRAALIALGVALAAPAGAGTPLALAERQVVTLEFDRQVGRLAVTDPDLLALKASGSRVKVTALRPGRAALEIAFDDGATVTYDVVVDAARRQTVRAPAANEIDLLVGEERRVRVHGIAQAFLDENGVARARVEGDAVAVVGVSAGATSLVVVDAAGVRTTFTVRVR